jgi:hypothetical protein
MIYFAHRVRARIIYSNGGERSCSVTSFFYRDNASVPADAGTRMKYFHAPHQSTMAFEKVKKKIQHHNFT